MGVSLVELLEDVDGKHFVVSLVRTHLKHIGVLTHGTCEITNLTMLSC